MEWSPEAPYNALPPLPPGVKVATEPVLQKLIVARASLAALNELCGALPNPNLLVNAVTMIEAQASSEIENVFTTTDDLFRQAQKESDQIQDPAVRETLRYREALYAGMVRIAQRPLTAESATEICSVLEGREMRLRDLPGTFIGDGARGVRRYTPPEGPACIRDHLAAWERFVHEESELDPLLRMSLAHYQFEAIHPFSDGNGRTGRILNLLQLSVYGLLDWPVLYLSEYIIEHKQEYYDLLLGVTRDAAWEPWNLFMLSAVHETAERARHVVKSLLALQRLVQEQMTAILGRGDANLLDVLFELPYCRIPDVVERCGISRPTATKYLERLVQGEVLVRQRIGRETLYINAAMLQILRRNRS